MRSGTKLSANSYTQSNDALEPILPDLQYKASRATFEYDVAFNKGANED